MRRTGSHNDIVNVDLQGELASRDALHPKESNGNYRPAGLKGCLSDTALHEIDFGATFQNVKTPSPGGGDADNASQTSDTCSLHEDPMKLLTRLAVTLIDNVQQITEEEAASSTDDGDTSVRDMATSQDDAESGPSVEYGAADEKSADERVQTWNESAVTAIGHFWLSRKTSTSSQVSGQFSARTSLRSHDRLIFAPPPPSPAVRQRKQRSISECGSPPNFAAVDYFQPSAAAAQDVEREVAIIGGREPPQRSFRMAQRKKSVSGFTYILDQVRLSRQNSQANKENDANNQPSNLGEIDREREGNWSMSAVQVWGFAARFSGCTRN